MPRISSFRESTGVSSDAGEASMSDVPNPHRISSAQRPSTSLTPPTAHTSTVLANLELNDAERLKALFPLLAEEPDSESKREDEREMSPTPYKTIIKSANSPRDKGLNIPRSERDKTVV
jgi:hypothetical protein